MQVVDANVRSDYRPVQDLAVRSRPTEWMVQDGFRSVATVGRNNSVKLTAVGGKEVFTIGLALTTSTSFTQDYGPATLARSRSPILFPDS